jgi:ribonuclease HII
MKAGTKKGKNTPDRSAEQRWFARGYSRVAGLDEAGRGALAGPVVAAAVILPENITFPWIEDVRDSKLLNARQRETLFAVMLDAGIEIGLGIISPAVIDAVNILNATRQAMLAALEQITEPPDFVLTDAVCLPRLLTPQQNIIRGDRTCLCIACASIAAKVTRDRIMCEMHAEYPQYGFKAHKGYGTSQHLLMLEEHGACAIHRFTFSPVRALGRLL